MNEKCVLCSLALAMLLAKASINPARGQEPTPPARTSREAPRVEPFQFSVIPLKRANAPDVVNVLGGMMSDPRRFGMPPGRQPEMVVADSRTNSLLVRAPDDVVQQIKEIVKALDTEAAQPAEQIEIFELRHSPAVEVSRSLQIVAGPKVRIAADAVGNRIIAQGDAESLAKVRELVLRLDEPPAKPAVSEESAPQADDVQVRLVWLVAGLKDSPLAPPPADLANVIRELEKLGVEGLKTAAQVIVKTAFSAPFNVTGSAMLNQTCTLEVTGSFSRKQPEMPQPGKAAATPGILEISVSARPPQGEQLANLQTTITAPQGHSVVLGVSPVGELTSVFVVQVRP